MTLPRRVVPGQFLVITRRCTQRQFLLTPNDQTNDAFLYCLALAAERYGVDVMLPCVMSNHHHLEVFDRFGRSPEFTEYLHKLVARSQNCYLGRSENFWSSVQPSVVVLGNREDVIRKLVYTANNPVKANLVDRIDHWPGVNGIRELLEQRELVIARPRHFFRAHNLPDTVTLRLVVPPELGDKDVFLAEVRERVYEEEARLRAERLRTGTRIVGRSQIRKQSWRGYPNTPASRGGLKPRFAVIDRSARIEALERERLFLAEYRHARKAWRDGITTPFPSGTYWLRRFANVPIESSAAA
jgi:REP element-mobilizing transposase RayT